MSKPETDDENVRFELRRLIGLHTTAGRYDASTTLVKCLVDHARDLGFDAGYQHGAYMFNYRNVMRAGISVSDEGEIRVHKFEQGTRHLSPRGKSPQIEFVPTQDGQGEWIGPKEPVVAILKGKGIPRRSALLALTDTLSEILRSSEEKNDGQ